MTTRATSDDEYAIRVLAVTAAEFDRVRKALSRDDEPGPDEIARAVGGEESQTGIVAGLAKVASTASRLVVGSVHPRHEGWDEADVDTRIDWWVDRVGTAAAALAAVPSAGGVVTGALALDDLLGAAGQLLVVNAVGRELGVTDRTALVQTSARIVLGREISREEIESVIGPGEPRPVAAPLPEPADEPDVTMFGRLGSTGRLIWRVATQVRELRGDLNERPQGGVVVRALSRIPVIGAAGGFLAERSGVKQAAAEARAAFAHP